MPIFKRLLTLLAVLLLTLSATGIGLAQSDGPDPNSPIKLETPVLMMNQVPVNRTKAKIRNTDADDEDDATPESVASPVAGGDVSLAAMVLDSSSLPEGWFLIGEGYTSAEDLANSLAGQIDPAALLATGLELYYDSYYVNAEGNTVRTYIISFETPEGAADGFAILEDEETLVPNGSFEDLPGLEGVGSEPSEISTGTIENGDGTQTNSYDVSFTVGRYEIGAAMETYDGSEPDTNVVDQMASDIELRATAVIAGEPVEQIDYSLPDQVVTFETTGVSEGYQTSSEAFLVSDPELAPTGYLSGYFRSGSFSESITAVLPYVTVGVTTFESAEAVEAAMDNTDAIMPRYDLLDETDEIDVAGVDASLAFVFASPEGEGELDSVRLFLQIDDQLISIDVQGEGSIEDALALAQDLGDSQVSCVVDGECEPLRITDDSTL